MTVRNINIDWSGRRCGLFAHNGRYFRVSLCFVDLSDLFYSIKTKEWETLTHLCQALSTRTRLLIIKKKERKKSIEVIRTIFILKKHRHIHILHQISREWVFLLIRVLKQATILAIQSHKTIWSLRVKNLSPRIRSTIMIPRICRMMLSYLLTIGLQVLIKIYKRHIILRDKRICNNSNDKSQIWLRHQRH